MSCNVHFFFFISMKKEIKTLTPTPSPFKKGRGKIFIKVSRVGSLAHRMKCRSAGCHTDNKKISWIASHLLAMTELEKALRLHHSEGEIEKMKIKYFKFTRRIST